MQKEIYNLSERMKKEIMVENSPGSMKDMDHWIVEACQVLSKINKIQSIFRNFQRNHRTPNVGDQSKKINNTNIIFSVLMENNCQPRILCTVNYYSRVRINSRYFQSKGIYSSQKFIKTSIGKKRTLKQGKKIQDTIVNK